jgi:phage terminase small subunit
MKGGHARSGPAQLDAEERRLRGSRTRPHHIDREKAQPTNVSKFPKCVAADQSELHLKAPSHLGQTGLDEWRRLADLLRAEGRLSVSDRPALAVAAGAYELAAQIRRRKNRARGDDFLRFAAAERNAMQEFRKTLSDLCLNPATRARAPKPKNRLPNDPRRERFFGGAK